MYKIYPVHPANLVILSNLILSFSDRDLLFLDRVQFRTLDFLRNFEIAVSLLRHSHCLGGLFTFPS
jgi:hypothetical protein